MIKLPIFILMWALYIAIKLPTVIIGWFVGLLMYGLRHTDYVDLPFWTRPFANPEDWKGQQNHYKEGLPRWYYNKYGPSWYHWYRYNFWRNGANGLRSFELLDLTIVPEKVRFIRSKNFTEDRYDVSKIRELKQSTVWFFAWQRLQAGCEFIHIWHDGGIKRRPRIVGDGFGFNWSALKFWEWRIKIVDVTYPPRHLNIKFGWRVEPSDANPDLHHGIGSNDASFASKFLFGREG